MPGIVVFAHQRGIPAHQLTRLLYTNFSSQAAVNSGSFIRPLMRNLSALVKTLYSTAHTMTNGSLRVGQQAPDFTATAVVDQEFKEISLSNYRGKYVVLFFYPLDFTFVCPTEITAFSDRYAEFASKNTEVLGVSVDSQFSHLAWIQTDRKEGGIGDLAYPLVADLKKDIARAYNVLDEDAGIAVRGLFIIDAEGVVQHATINNLAVGRNVEETLRVLQAFQHVQANPDQVCPANWTPGDRTMNPDPVGSKDFFAAIS